MGYYDDEQSQGRYREKGKKGSFFLASLVGAIIGAMLVVFTIPTLSNQGILPYQISPNQNPATGIEPDNNNQQNGIQQQISYDVNTNTTQAVDKTAEAVVGINNIQSSSFWSDN